ncbi:MATE family efflux transporter [Metabacillus sp. GX 13764]|uniref:MATE family efflux transporter n=1 Tax=Metabacillus kandeliae TaxID=2900151 RepID=UPI001E2DC7BF|nr:MATE family efflux transporter [Metabacillus kandeliae]MCD7034918.1 MATE family efflux transporter [Metabacillus kandeliae]
MRVDLQHRKITIFSLTWPIFIELFLYMLMGNTDTLMLSMHSDEAVAAVGVSNQILQLVIVMFGFMAAGSTILITQNLGAKRGQDAKDIALISIIFNAILGLVISVILYFFSKSLLGMMNLPLHLMPDADVYLEIVGGFSFIQALIMTASAILRSYGYTRETMYVTVGMNILHIIGNTLFLFGPFGIPVLGVAGVAVSTAVSRFAGLILILFILAKKVPFPVFSRLKSLPLHHFRTLVKIGLPSAGEQLSFNVSQMVITYFVSSLGTEALATKVYAQNLMMFIYLMSLALSQGTQIVIGRMIGAKDYESAFNRCLKTLYMAIGLSTVTALGFHTFSDSLFHIFTSNESIIHTGGLLILLTVLLEPGRAFNLVINNALRAAGDVRFPVFMGGMSVWCVSVPAAFLLSSVFGLGLIGIWIAFILDEWLRGILMYKRWKSKQWVTKGFVSSREPALREKPAIS